MTLAGTPYQLAWILVPFILLWILIRLERIERRLADYERSRESRARAIVSLAREVAALKNPEVKPDPSSIVHRDVIEEFDDQIKRRREHQRAVVPWYIRLWR